MECGTNQNMARAHSQFDSTATRTRAGAARRFATTIASLVCVGAVTVSVGNTAGIAAAESAGHETGSVTTGSIADGQASLGTQAPPGLSWPAPTPSETPPSWVASTLPTPITDDPFFAQPTEIDELPAGTIIRTRGVELPDLTFPPTETTQVMVRSNDSHDRPIASTATVIVPAQPWGGPGTRPTLVINRAINGLGAKCAPSYKMVHEPGGLDLPPLTALSLWRGYAVLLPDHEGPQMAYGAGILAGHIVLDSVRGLRQLAGFSESKVVLTGYSGGAIATGWAAQLAPSYAPELDLAGVAAGGTPADLSTLRTTMDGTLGSGLYTAAAVGLTREYPELLTNVNEAGKIALQSEVRNICDMTGMAIGAAMLPISTYTFPNVQDTPLVKRVLDQNKMGGAAPTAPVLLYQGSSKAFLGDEFIPEEQAEALSRQWCSLGANVRYEEVVGEHMSAAIVAMPMLLDWIAARFADEPPAGNCL